MNNFKIYQCANIPMRFDAWQVGTLAHYLDGESVEASVYGDHGTGYECGGIARQPLQGAE